MLTFYSSLVNVLKRFTALWTEQNRLPWFFLLFMHDFSLTFEKRLLKKKKIPVWLHDQTDNIQKMQGDTSWSMVVPGWQFFMLSCEKEFHDTMKFDVFPMNLKNGVLFGLAKVAC